MYPLFFIAKNNIKKHKGEVAILFALIFLSAVLMFSSISLILSGDKTMYEVEEKYNSSDLFVGVTGISAEEMRETIESVESTEKCEIVSAIWTAADYYYGSMNSEDAMSNEFQIFDSSQLTELNAFPEEYKNLKDDEIVLPYYLSYSIGTGENYTIKIGGREHKFKVAGYVENLYFATTMNISGVYSLVSHNVFEQMSADTDEVSKIVIAYADTKEGTDISEYELAIQRALPGELSVFTVTKETMEMATTAVSKIASSLIMVFTLLLILMSVIIMHFSIRNFIELNIQNIGLLQATGYTARSLRLACVTEQMIIGLIATCAGIGAGVLCNAPLNSLSGMLNGLSGTGDISITALVSTIVSIPLMVLIGSFIATRSYKKMSVLESLRSGITAHNFKKNHFPLETSRLPLELAIACKNNFGAMKKSIFITLIVAVLTASTCIGFALFQNWALDNKMLLKVVGVEIADIMATTPGDEDFIEEMKDDPNVKNINTKTSLKTVEVTYQDHTESLGIDVFRDVNSLNNNYLLEGHMPCNGNEIVLTCVEADNLNVTLGDIVNVKSMTDSGTVPYTVCGIDQKMNNTGKKALLSEEGAKRINSEFMYETTLIYLNDPAKAKEIKKQWEKDYPDYTFALGEDIMASSIDTVTKAMEGICVIFVIATCFVVILTQLLLTRAQVIRERTDLGVSKALGYTSGELIRRTLMTNLPTIALGVILGIVLHIALSNKLFLVVFSFFGIRQIVFHTNAIWFVITAAIIMLCAIVTAFASGRGIAKLEPVKILKEE